MGSQGHGPKSLSKKWKVYCQEELVVPAVAGRVRVCICLKQRSQYLGTSFVHGSTTVRHQEARTLDCAEGTILSGNDSSHPKWASCDQKKKRGFWWGRTEHKSFISFKANGLPRFISLDLSDRTIYEKLLTMSPRLQHERIPYGLNIRGKKKRKQKHLYFPALLREQTCQNKKTRQFFGYCFCFSFLLWDRQHGRKDTDLEIEKPGFRLLALLVVIWVAWGKSFGLSEMHQ